MDNIWAIYGIVYRIEIESVSGIYRKKVHNSIQGNV
jgi:hypothetical protein